MTSSVGAGVHYDVYELTTASATTIQASLCAAGGGSANFDSFVAVYQAPGGAQQPGFVPNGCTIGLAANDDFCGSASQVTGRSMSAAIVLFASRISSPCGEAAISEKIEIMQDSIAAFIRSANVPSAASAARALPKDSATRLAAIAW